MDLVAEGHGEGEGAGGDVPPPARCAEENYFYIVKCIGAKND